VEIVGGRRFVEIAGGRTHELPPLLVHSLPALGGLESVVDLAGDIVESEDLVAAPPVENAALELEFQRRRMGLAVSLVEEYRNLLTHWTWGDSIAEWIRQCEITFVARPELRALLRPDVWPHAGRSSFVTLLEDKAAGKKGVDVARAVGLRLTFRQPPPIECFSNQFLLLLKQSVAASAYIAWAGMTPAPVSSLPPERFRFEVVDMAQ